MIFESDCLLNISVSDNLVKNYLQCILTWRALQGLSDKSNISVKNKCKSNDVCEK